MGVAKLHKTCSMSCETKLLLFDGSKNQMFFEFFYFMRLIWQVDVLNWKPHLSIKIISNDDWL